MSDRIFLQNRSGGHNKYYALMTGSDGKTYGWYGSLSESGMRFKTCTVTQPKQSAQAFARKKERSRGYADVSSTSPMWVDAIGLKMNALERDLKGEKRTKIRIADYLVEF